IESFSNQVLQLMRKGCTGLQNIQLLRWCEELGITVFWNLLYGFPTESPAEYARMAELIPLLTHLQRPGYCGKIHVDRFSPLFTVRGLGISHPRPAAAYSCVYPLGDAQLSNLAYFFEFDSKGSTNPPEYTRALAHEIDSWPEWTSPNRPRLDLFRTGSIVLITDTRNCAIKATHLLTGLDAALYLECDPIQPPASLARKLGDGVTESDVRSRLDSFCDARIIAEMDGRYLSLAVLRNRAASAAQPRRAIDFQPALSIIS